MSAVKTILVGDGIAQGVVARLVSLEEDSAERKEFLKTVVDPARQQLAELVLKMGRVEELVSRDEKQQEEIILLRERVNNLNKIMWLLEQLQQHWS